MGIDSGLEGVQIVRGIEDLVCALERMRCAFSSPWAPGGGDRVVRPGHM